MEFKVTSCCSTEFPFRRTTTDMMLRRWDFSRASSSSSEHHGLSRECSVSTIKDFWHRLTALAILVKTVSPPRKSSSSTRTLRFWRSSNGFSFNSANTLSSFGSLAWIRNTSWVMSTSVPSSYAITYLGATYQKAVIIIHC